MEDLKKMAALTALNQMLAKSYFDICKLDSVAKMLNIVPAGEAYNVLRTMHCIDYAAMPQELRNALPDLIQQVLGVAPAYQFKTLERQVIEVSPEPKRKFLRLLGG